MPTATVCNLRRELASGGIEVTLYWSAHDNCTSVEIWQPEPEETLTFRVGSEWALNAFYHRFAHLPTASLE
jgi:hypothetical protein